MKVICNGEEQEIRTGCTVRELIVSLGLKPETVVVECDAVILKPDEYPTLQLHEGSRLELIHFVGGG